MQLFYAPDFVPPQYTLSEEESRHAVRVLRMECGDTLFITDGRGTLFECRITEASPKRCTVSVERRTDRFEQRPYRLTMAVAPTKNIERFEWFLEKATEIGIDRIVPLRCEHSERHDIKPERENKVIIAALKQSLKAFKPELAPVTPFRQAVEQAGEGVRLIAHCRDDAERIFMPEAFKAGDDVTVFIGPEGDFSADEIDFAKAHGFREITLGTSRLRTETAAVVATAIVATVNGYPSPRK